MEPKLEGFSPKKFKKPQLCENPHGGIIRKKPLKKKEEKIKLIRILKPQLCPKRNFGF